MRAHYRVIKTIFFQAYSARQKAISYQPPTGIRGGYAGASAIKLAQAGASLVMIESGARRSRRQIRPNLLFTAQKIFALRSEYIENYGFFQGNDAMLRFRR